MLGDAWSLALTGSRQVVVVGGEPGAGKSRLLAEQCMRLHGQDAWVLLGTCVADLGLPYQPFVQPVEVLLATQQGDRSTIERLQVVAGRGVLRHRPDKPEHRRQLYDSVIRGLRELSRQQPLVLALEDLHWAGPPALELLTYLVEQLAECRLLVLVTHRTTAPDRSRALVAAVSRLSRLDGVRRLDLGGLRTEDIADYLGQEAGVPAQIAHGPAAVLRHQTGGNPFFLREMWRDLARRGGISAVRAVGVQAPGSVRDALQGRLVGLSESQRQTLELAAVIGEEVDVSVLLAASAWSRDTTLIALDDGVDYGLLEAIGPTTYRFPHTLARNAVLDLLPPSRRARQHARVAEVLEARPTRSVQSVQALAHHYEQAQALGYHDKAVRYLVEAAHAAGNALAHEDAARLFEKAAALSADAPTRTGLQLSAARAHLLGGDFARARELAEQVTTAAAPRERLQAAVLYEAASWRPGLPGHRAVELLSAGLQAVTTEHDPLRIRAFASLGRALAFTGDTEGARSTGADAVDRARRTGDDGLLAHALQASLWHGLRPGDAPAKLDRATELSALAHRTGDLGQLGPAAYYRGVISYMQGDPEGWRQAHADSVHMSQGTGQSFFTYMSGCLEYGLQFVRGDFAGAGRTCQELLDLGEGFGTDGTEGPSAMQTFMVRRETGAVQHVRALVSGQEAPSGHWAPGLLALYTALDLDQAASRLLHWLLADQLGHHRDSAHWPAVLAFLLEAALHLDDTAVAERLRPELLEYAGHNLVAGQFVALFGSADRYLGAVDSLLGRRGAEDWFASALAMDERTDAPVHQAYTLAATVVHRRRVGDRGDELAELVRRTRALAEPLGLTGPLRQIGLSAGATGRPVSPRRSDGLTAREAQVLMLLAEGLANREIAERLVISEHTAANHVRSILSKTGSANRTKAAMYAAGRNLGT